MGRIPGRKRTQFSAMVLERTQGQYSGQQVVLLATPVFGSGWKSKQQSRNSHAMKKLNFLLPLGVAAFLLGCASASKPIVLAPVGPSYIPFAGAPLAPPTAPTGSLQVYSAQVKSGLNAFNEVYFQGHPGVYELAHTDYTIYSADGRVYRHVRNADGVNDPTPALVDLPPGTYTIRAQAMDGGLVRVPVVIEPGQVTTVQLQGTWNPPDAIRHKDQYVWLDGTVVGWRAPSVPKAVGGATR